MTTPLPPIDQPATETPDSRPRLQRSATDRMLGGVSGGLAEYSGIDTVLWRVGFVVLTLLGGSGILFYLLLWVLMPSAPLPDGAGASPIERGIGRLREAVIGLFSPSDRRP
jgi:phage shock protein PspC (stress-responsive transcriptional regulator)